MNGGRWGPDGTRGECKAEAGDPRLRQRRSSTAAPGGRSSFLACRPQICMKLLAPVHFNSLRDGPEAFSCATPLVLHVSLLLRVAAPSVLAS